MKKWMQVLMHLAFWLAFRGVIDLLIIAAQQGGGGPPEEVIRSYTWGFLYLPGAFAYAVAVLWLFTRFAKTKRYGALAGWGFLTVVAAAALGSAWFWQTG